jgi:hypothetical protein
MDDSKLKRIYIIDKDAEIVELDIDLSDILWDSVTAKHFIRQSVMYYDKEIIAVY